MFPAPPTTVVLSTALVLLFFLGLFSIYFCRCFLESLMDNWHFVGRIPAVGIHGVMINPHHGVGGVPPNPEDQGLDPALIKRFPTFSYSEVNKYRKEKYELECAICLAEFEDVDLIRLLTACYHVFHLPCIDLWLQSNKTCPVCRQNLDQISSDNQEKTPLNALDQSNANVVEGNNRGVSDHSITISIDNLDCRGGQDDGHSGGNDNGNEDTDDNMWRMRRNILQKLGRPHSTGHSIVVTRSPLGDGREDEEDKYTLRLMNNVTVKMITPIGRHCATESCIAFGEFSSHENSNINDSNVTNYIGHGQLREVAGTSTSLVS
ncbi:RING-H2 finger protein ATL29 [Linum perenne]